MVEVLEVLEVSTPCATLCAEDRGGVSADC